MRKGITIKGFLNDSSVHILDILDKRERRDLNDDNVNSTQGSRQCIIASLIITTERE
jgi:hypothetical protein